MREWCATAERLEAAATEAEAAGRRVSARALYLRASSYFSTGLYLITHSGAPGRQLDIWRRHRACWDKLVDLAPVPGERLRVPYQDTTLPGYFYHEVLKYRLGDEVAGITTPLLITEPEDEQLWPGQSQALYDRLPGPRQLVRFTAAEGADRHCEPMGLATRDIRVFDWLDRHLAA